MILLQSSLRLLFIVSVLAASVRVLALPPLPSLTAVSFPLPALLITVPDLLNRSIRSCCCPPPPHAAAPNIEAKATTKHGAILFLTTHTFLLGVNPTPLPFPS